MKRCGLLVGLLLVACTAQPSAVPVAPTRTASPAPSPTISTTPRPTAAPTSQPRLDGSALAALIDRPALRMHLDALQEIADATQGGNRATGTPGFDGSVDHVAMTLKAAGYEVDERDFTVAGVSSTNVLAELPGSGSGVVIIGAHLDSVTAGPGINDNGSGVATLLVIAEQLRQLAPPDSTIRFAFWGAEEGGPFGSREYVESLSAEERAEIVAYLNFDMLASPNAVRFVYDEDDAPQGSDELTARFVAAFEDAGLGWDRIDVDRRSDHGPFAAAGIPVGGLFSGGRELVTEVQAAGSGAVAAQPSDPCSDAPCDTIGNVDLATHVEMSRIVARVLVELASRGSISR
jgi:aminopeptidase S